jgi:hypothetical protein
MTPFMSEKCDLLKPIHIQPSAKFINALSSPL